MRKTFFLFMLLGLSKLSAIACGGCSRGQPRLLRYLSHGAGPDSKWDYWIVLLAVVMVIMTLYYSVKWLIKPGERSPDHIKNLVLTDA